MAKTETTKKSEKKGRCAPNKAIEPIKIPQIIFKIMKIFFLEYLSINVPAYKPQKKVKNVIIRYEEVKKSGRFTIFTKYHGIAIILIPCANPDIILARNNNTTACLFFIITKVLFKVRIINFERCVLKKNTLLK